MGFHPRPPIDYDGDYFGEYVRRDASDMGAGLTQARIEFVRRHWGLSTLTDIGIGGGRFVEETGCTGFDVNPQAIEWLIKRNRFLDPYAAEPPCITCWDSLEHIPEPEVLINRVSNWVFVSMPIYKDAQDCLRSKHYKPGEHIWYWTEHGLIAWFNRLGFRLVDQSDFESRLGREGIYSYAFERR